MAEQHAYSTADPDIVAAFLATSEAAKAHARKVVDAAKAIGNNLGAIGTDDIFSPMAVIGLKPDNPDDPPPGWRCVKDRLRPAVGLAGIGACAWMTAHETPKLACVRTVMEGHGLPRHSIRGPSPSGGTFLGVPAIWHHDGTVWALYEGPPSWWSQPKEPGPQWERAKLSAYHLAREAHDQATATDEET